MNEDQDMQFMEFLIYAKHSHIDFTPNQIEKIANSILDGKGW